MTKMYQLIRLILRERHVLGADHQRQHEVAEDGRHGGNQDEEHHHDAVHREQLVVGVRRPEITGRRRELGADAGGERAAEHERQRTRDQVHQADALVVLGQQPRLMPNS
jgi:hypothetical protein